MPSAIDRIGAYRGKFVETGMGATKSGLPQFVGRLLATEKYVDEAEEMAHFEITEPGWVDWSGYQQDILAYLILIGKEGQRLLNFEQLQKALGWDGASFAALGAGNYEDKIVMFRVEENEWEGKVSLKVNWVDEPDAPITMGLRTLDVNALKNLDAQYANVLSKKASTVVAAKAPSKPVPKPLPGKVAAPKAATAPAASKPAATTVNGAAQTSSSKPTGNSAPTTKKAPPAKSALTKDLESTVEAGMTYGEAWDKVSSNANGKSDDEVAEAFTAAAAEVAPGKSEDDLTPEECAKFAGVAIAKLAS